MFCMNCGQELPEMAKFCFSCGSKIEDMGVKTMHYDSIEAMRKAMSEDDGEYYNKFLDNEECFGFHSEYYIDPNSRKSLINERTKCCVEKGYTSYCNYKDDFYFIPRSENDGFVLKVNVKQKKTYAIRLELNRKIDFSNDYIAVNRQGIFLYNKREVMLFDFEGRRISSHKFPQIYHSECIYIYDDKVFYSVTEVMTSKVYCVNMLTQRLRVLWEMQKDGSVLDKYFKDSYKKQWGKEMVSCEFLYANQKRVVAGYVRSKHPNCISYIINFDMETEQSSILEICLDVNLSGNSSNSCIFSFNMLTDTMWVKKNGNDIELIQVDIQKMPHLHALSCEEWKLCKSSSYYFDGKQAYIPNGSMYYCIEQNGKRRTLNNLDFPISVFRCFDNIYINSGKDINGEQEISFWDINSNGNYSLYDVCESDIEKLIRNAKTL